MFFSYSLIWFATRTHVILRSNIWPIKLPIADKAADPRFANPSSFVQWMLQINELAGVVHPVDFQGISRSMMMPYIQLFIIPVDLKFIKCTSRWHHR